MEIHKSTYIGSFPNEAKCPESTLPEYAFIGRSNVGKSSLINMVTQRKDLARVSKTPGKTQYLNYYLIDDTWHLVDLPGYGYAVRSKSQRAKWGRMIEVFLKKRESLACAFILVDCSIEPQKIDLEFIDWMAENNVPFCIVYTKSDKAKPMRIKENIEKFEAKLLESWEELPQHFVTSSVGVSGREELLELIGSVNSKID